MNNKGIVREAILEDMDAIEHLENTTFGMDRFSRRQLRYLLTRANSTVLVIEEGNQIVGAAVVLWRKGLSVGRLYSMVVDEAFRGQRFGHKLLKETEKIALHRGCKAMSLEVRADNLRAISFYKRQGYKIRTALPGFYADGTNGLRMLKEFSNRQLVYRMDVPYYAQSLEFTCGPACLMMAMKYFDQQLELNKSLELMLWKEATLIFMTSGIGGSDPFGLAVAGARRGYRCRVFLSENVTPFLSSVRNNEKKEVIRLVHEQLKNEAQQLGVSINFANLTFKEIETALRNHEIPIILISASRLHKERAPHWVVVTGFDNNNVYLHDPYEGFYIKNDKQARHVKCKISEFLKMHRHSQDLKKSVVFIKGNRRTS